MKVGINISIDVTKLDKNRFNKGKYADITAFVDLDQQDQYGQNGFVTQSTSKEEREGGLKLPILGNSKVFYNSAGTQAPQQQAPNNPQNQAQPEQGSPYPANDNFEDDIPF